MGNCVKLREFVSIRCMGETLLRASSFARATEDKSARPDNKLSPDYGDASPSQVRSGRLSGAPKHRWAASMRAGLGWVQATAQYDKEQRGERETGMSGSPSPFAQW